MKHVKLLITGSMIASMWVSGCSKMKPQTSKENSVADIVSDGVHDYIRIPVKGLKGEISKIMLGKVNLLNKVIIDGCDPTEANGCENIAKNNKSPEDPTQGNGTAMATPKFDNEDPTRGGDPLILINGEEFALVKIAHDKAPQEYKDAVAAAKEQKALALGAMGGSGNPDDPCGNEPTCGGIDPKARLELDLHYKASSLGLSDTEVEVIKVTAALGQK